MKEMDGSPQSISSVGVLKALDYGGWWRIGQDHLRGVSPLWLHNWLEWTDSCPASRSKIVFWLTFQQTWQIHAVECCRLLLILDNWAIYLTVSWKIMVTTSDAMCPFVPESLIILMDYPICFLTFPSYCIYSHRRCVRTKRKGCIQHFPLRNRRSVRWYM